jgi:uncharacterized protein
VLDASPLLRRRRSVVAAVFAVALAAAPGILRLELDNSPQGFLVDDDREVTRHRELVAVFGRDTAVRVVVSGDALWTRRGLAWLAELEERLEELPGVLGAAGLARREAAAAGAWPPAVPAALRAEIAADVVARGAGWVSADGSLATVVVALARQPPGRGAATLAAIEALAATAPPGVTAHLVGLPVVERALDEQAAAMMARFFPSLALLLAAALAVFFRRVRHVAAVIAVVAVAEVTTLGAMGWSGARLDVVTALLVPLLAVVATAAAVHLLVRFRHLRERRMDGMAAARELVRQKARPVAWGGITTIAGFASLAVAPVPAVRSLGIWAAFGLAWTTLAALTLLPCLLAGDGGRPAPGRRRAGGGRSPAGAPLGGGGGAPAPGGGRRLRRGGAAGGGRRPAPAAGERHPRPPRRRPPGARRRGGARGRRAGRRGRRPGARPAARRRRRLRRGGGPAAPGGAVAATAHPAARPGVLSAGDLVAAHRRETHADGGGERASWRRAREAVAARPGEARLLRFLLAADGRRARVALTLPMSAGGDADELFAAARREARSAFPRAESHVTGSYPLVLAAQRSLLATMLHTFAVAVVLVALCLRLVLGSAALAARALAVNLWPVLVALGVMGWLRVPVDSATLAVAAVALGLAVDDTLHTFADFRRHAGRRGRRPAIVAAVGRNAPAHLVTALLLAGGFALFGLSGFVPAARFGLLTAAAIAAALAADLLLIPALLAGPAPTGRDGGSGGARAVRPGATPRAGRAGPRRRQRGAPAPGG